MKEPCHNNISPDDSFQIDVAVILCLPCTSIYNLSQLAISIIHLGSKLYIMLSHNYSFKRREGNWKIHHHFFFSAHTFSVPFAQIIFCSTPIVYNARVASEYHKSRFFYRAAGKLFITETFMYPDVDNSD